jgi:hypothetical protein
VEGRLQASLGILQCCGTHHEQCSVKARHTVIRRLWSIVCMQHNVMMVRRIAAKDSTHAVVLRLEPGKQEHSPRMLAWALKRGLPW